MKFALALVASAAACMNTMDLSNVNLIKLSEVRTRKEASNVYKEAWNVHPDMLTRWNNPSHKGCVRTSHGGVSGDRIEVALAGGKQSISHVNVFVEPTFDAENTIEGARVIAGWRSCGSLTATSSCEWDNVKCPAGTKAKEIQIFQPKSTPYLAVCGIQVYG